MMLKVITGRNEVLTTVTSQTEMLLKGHNSYDITDKNNAKGSHSYGITGIHDYEGHHNCGITEKHDT